MSYLESSIVYALHRARLSVVEYIREAFADHQITAIEFLAMIAVAENPGISQADLAKALRVERPRIVPTLDRLEERGLAKRTVSAADSRFRQIHLTKSGSQLLRILQRRAGEHQKKIMAQLDEAEARTLLSSLWKLADHDWTSKKR